MENPIKMDDLGVPLFLVQHPYFFHVHTESLFPASEIVLQEYNTKFVQIAVYSQFANCYSINKERKLALFQLTIKLVGGFNPSQKY